MNLCVFALYDVKASFFSAPMFFAHRGMAIRAVIELGSDLSTMVGRHPADYHLYELGLFDDQTGSFQVAPPLSLGPVLSFLPAASVAPPPSLFPLERGNGEARP